jgi:hypothetical protein
MTGGEFFTAIGIHYGRSEMQDGKPVRIPRKYDDVIGADVASWMRSNFPKDYDYKPLFDAATTLYSANYGKLPDKAQLVKAEMTLPRAPIQGVVHTFQMTPEETALSVAMVAQMEADLKAGTLVKRATTEPRTVERRDPYASDRSLEAEIKPSGSSVAQSGNQPPPKSEGASRSNPERLA